MFRFTPVVTRIIIINVLVHFIISFAGGYQSTLFHLGALHYTESPLFYPWQFFTYMFLHSQSDFMHLFGNMFGILIFGPLLEEFWGAKRFLVYYLLCGIGAGLLYTGYQFYEFSGISEAKNTYLENPTSENYSYYFYEYDRDVYSNNIEHFDYYRDNPEDVNVIEQGKESVVMSYNRKVNIPMVGASGALFGILIAFALLFPNTELIFFPLFIPIKAKYVVAVYGIIEYFAVIRNAPGDQVAHIAHLGGMLVGFIIVKYWQRHRSRFY